MSDDQIKEILKNSKTIAMIGVSSEKKGEDPKNLKRKPAIVKRIKYNFHFYCGGIFPKITHSHGSTANGSPEGLWSSFLEFEKWRRG